ncbi:MAG: AAA family ATPase [Planctomycetes bacterium]|nr:AAA family ATPase [Planctomycetota bacterium]
MSRSNQSPHDQGGGGPPQGAGSQAEMQVLMRRLRDEPAALLGELLTLRAHLARAKDQCAASAAAARKLEEMLRDLLEGSALCCHLEHLREPERRAVVRAGGEARELPIHPSVDLAELRDLEPWEVVRVRENVVIGAWRGDACLLPAAEGEVAEFRGLFDREGCLARVVRRGGEEEVVRLARSLRERPIPARAKLVLHRSLPGWAIDVLPADSARSRFEVPLGEITTQLDDLAGLDEIAEKILEEIRLRLVRADVSERFALEPMRGALLISYKPGMGKTALMRAIARFLHDVGQRRGFDVALYVVKPNETKNLYHGEDARIVREDLWGAIRARQAEPRKHPLLQLVVLDEIDSLGKRAEVDRARLSAAEDDALQAFLAEMDGMQSESVCGGAPARVLCVGMTNRPDRIDPALKRPGRFGDLVVHMPEIDLEGGVGILSVYARALSISWFIDGRVQQGVDLETLRARILRPALARVFPAVVLRYATDTQRTIDVTAGELLAGAHYMSAMRQAKHQAARREVASRGIPAVSFHDVLESLIDVALTQAGQLEADPGMLLRELRVKVPVARVDAVPRAELAGLRFVRAESA